MKKSLGLLLALALVTGACGDDDDGGIGKSTDPAAASTCAELADVTINLLQEAIDSVADLTLTDFMDLAGTDQMPEAINRLDTMGADLQSRADALGCSDEDGEALICERIGNLSADTEISQLILGSIGDSC